MTGPVVTGPMTTSTDVVIGIDLGTTSAKAVIRPVAGGDARNDSGHDDGAHDHGALDHGADFQHLPGHEFPLGPEWCPAALGGWLV